MSTQFYSVVEVAALVLGVAGPLWALLREVWRSEWLSLIWERRSVLAAVVRELLLLVFMVGIVYGHTVILELAVDTVSVPSRIYDALRYVSLAVGVSVLVAVAGRALYQGIRFFQAKNPERSTPPPASET